MQVHTAVSSGGILNGCPSTDTAEQAFCGRGVLSVAVHTGHTGHVRLGGIQRHSGVPTML